MLSAVLLPRALSAAARPASLRAAAAAIAPTRRSFGATSFARADDGKKPLPNLNIGQGLASQTLLGQVAAEQAERAASESASASASNADPAAGTKAEPDADGASSSTDRKKARKAKSSDDGMTPAQNLASNVFLVALVAGTVYYFGRPDDDHPDKSWSPSAMWDRAKDRVSAMTKEYTTPAFEKLLPDPLPPGYQREYTLVINLNDTLIHSEWTSQHGWRVAKRPGIDYFLGYLSRFYEIVVFTRSQGFTAYPIIDKLDTYQGITYRLFRDATHYHNGKHVKDLSRLNRDLSKVVIMDWDEDAYSLQPENAIHLDRWDGKPTARSLNDYIPFLEMIALSGVPDVRPILQSYQGADVPTKFAERQAEYRRRIAEELKKAEEEAHANASSRSGGLLGLLGGGKGMALRRQQEQQMDLFRHSQLMQKQFEEEAAMIKAEADNARAAQEEQLKAMKEAMAKKTTLYAYIRDNMMGPPPAMPMPPADGGASAAPQP
ncbi:dullard-like phosphatase domain-containing protein [Allomyces macrogynus ATCC 38327]|uniref:Mitochondrial import inner membrane translocase subunit TIM50 n=1 Tax=Allomyces macrogynus (strain ATCC 38327) TaxID=578462 RepID=A0A0L0SS66_ALLM3|nr:dullard-like phosphatase domain-containing protein [Allomyces macrogynus ATCC 38327]|eukprot:KNE65200.1 dullard-like phosphatase domain-containing protein [Allomyces macrogynus ATCC 38327]